MKKETRRKLTDEEREHAARLLWRCTEKQLAAHLGCTEGSLSHALRQIIAMPASTIERLKATTKEQLPKKATRPKPKRESKLFIGPRSGYNCCADE